LDTVQLLWKEKLQHFHNAASFALEARKSALRIRQIGSGH
jgi:uncharacterized protein YjbK